MGGVPLQFLSLHLSNGGYSCPTHSSLPLQGSRACYPRTRAEGLALVIHDHPAVEVPVGETKQNMERTHTQTFVVTSNVLFTLALS